MIALPGKLRRLGILGINQRNADYIMRYNPRSRFPLVDDKLYTKKLADQYGIAVPELYTVIEIEHDVRQLCERVAEHRQFVVKPAQGSGGNGVLVITGHIGKNYVKSSGSLMSREMLERHTSNILSGMYSLGGVPDKAIVEYMVQFDPLFEHISFQGVPDIRVIVFRGIPVAAMVRLPTRASDGKANLHQGAVGVGIDLTSGVTHHGVWGEELINFHPDTGALIAGTEMPHWPRILELAARCSDFIGLGYIGVDIVLDKHLGPLVLEFNARPGLNVQLATGCGLLHNLHKVEALSELPETPEQRVEYARNELGHAPAAPAES